MSLTLTKTIPRTERISRNLGVFVGTIAFDSSYPTGGEDTSDITANFKNCLQIQFQGKSGYIFEWDKTNDKVKALTPTKAQAAVTTDKVTIVASGAANITDGQSCLVDSTFRSAVDAGAADEVANTTNLSTVTGVPFVAIGLI